MSSLHWLTVVARHMPERNRRQIAEILELAAIARATGAKAGFAELDMHELGAASAFVQRMLPPPAPQAAGELVLAVVEQMAKPVKGRG